jgi:hypothetical protein
MSDQANPDESLDTHAVAVDTTVLEKPDFLQQIAAFSQERALKGRSPRQQRRFGSGTTSEKGDATRTVFFELEEEYFSVRFRAETWEEIQSRYLEVQTLVDSLKDQGKNAWEVSKALSERPEFESKVESKEEFESRASGRSFVPTTSAELSKIMSL